MTNETHAHDADITPDVTCQQCREVIVARMVNQCFAPPRDLAGAFTSLLASPWRNEE